MVFTLWLFESCQTYEIYVHVDNPLQCGYVETGERGYSTLSGSYIRITLVWISWFGRNYPLTWCDHNQCSDMVFTLWLFKSCQTYEIDVHVDNPLQCGYVETGERGYRFRLTDGTLTVLGSSLLRLESVMTLPCSSLFMTLVIANFDWDISGMICVAARVTSGSVVSWWALNRDGWAFQILPGLICRSLV